MHEMQSDASTLPARSRPDCGSGGRPQLVWLPATTINRGCDRTVLHCAGKTHLSTMDTRRRHQRLFRRDFSSMALNPYSHGKSHAQEMAESRIYGKAGSPPNRRRDTAGWHHFTRPRQHGLRRPGKTVTGNLPQTENGLQREGQFRPIRRRLSGHRGIERTARKGGETACGALHERTRTRTVPRKNRHHAY